VLAFTTGSRNAATWLPAETQRLLGDLIGAPTAVIRTDVPQHPEIWDELCGWYRPRAQRTDMQAWSVFGAGVQVLVRRGRLVLRTLSPIPVLYRGVVLHQGAIRAPPGADRRQVDITDEQHMAPRRDCLDQLVGQQQVQSFRHSGLRISSGIVSPTRAAHLT